MDVGKPIIAVVDDDAGVRDSIRSLLKLAGYESAVFSSADEFVHAAPPPETKCVVLDVKMPGMNGLQLQRLMKTVRPSLPLIFISAHYDENIRNRAMNEGAASFLAKPFDSAELLRTIAACIPPDAQQARWFLSVYDSLSEQGSATRRYPGATEIEPRKPEEEKQGSVRLKERARIAQELHDTLLQSFFVATMELGMASQRLPSDSPVKPKLERILQLMERGIEEGRDTIQGLRASAPHALDLVQALSSVPQELPSQPDIDFRVMIAGNQRPLQLASQHEIYRIGREALVNAFCHSRAKRVEFELEYTDNNLRLRVRDNGCGIDPQVLQSGRKRHWGLIGMRERAERIGGQLKISSSPAAGTNIELSIPGEIAFQLSLRQTVEADLWKSVCEVARDAESQDRPTIA